MLTEIIPDLSYKTAELAIAAILQAEMNNQETLLLDAGKTQEEIDNDYKFSVKRGLYYPKDASEMPLVNVYMQSATPDQQYSDGCMLDYTVVIDMYVCRMEEEANDGTISSGEKAANDRLDYLISQVFRILENEANYYKGFSGIYEKTNIQSIQKSVNEMDNVAYASMMARLQYKITITENTEQLQGFDIDGFLIHLNLDGKDTNDILIEK